MTGGAGHHAPDVAVPEPGDTCLAAVLVGARTVELRQVPIPPTGDDDGLLQVEATGVCGADWAPYQGQRYGEFFYPPVVLGHEVVGRVARIGPAAARRWGLEVGDRVVIEEPLPCGACPACWDGRHQMCPAPRYGSRSVDDAPGLWGGYAEYLYLAPQAMVHRMSPDVPVEVAPLYIPLANGIHWVQQVGRAGIGSTVVIQGPGQHGLGCVVAAREAGAGLVVVTGTSGDANRFALARKLGADVTVAVDDEDAVEAVAELTRGRMADTVVNVTEGAPAALGQAVALAGDRGTVVTAGTAHAPAEGFSGDLVMDRELTVVGVRGRPSRAIPPAIALIESGRLPLELLCTHTFAIEETERALQTLGGEHGRDHIHISVVNRP